MDFVGVEFFKNFSPITFSLEITRLPGGGSPHSENKTVTSPSVPPSTCSLGLFAKKGPVYVRRTTFIPLCHEDINKTRIRIHTVLCIHVCRWRHEKET